mmetsp:Transcript_38530/g.122148  ORF Transcript_38530/g.122148 Transcript_38530/m.122148 type:complete len:231 (+) Transcript_38530:1823-2515(+)
MAGSPSGKTRSWPSTEASTGGGGRDGGGGDGGHGIDTSGVRSSALEAAARPRRDSALGRMDPARPAPGEPPPSLPCCEPSPSVSAFEDSRESELDMRLDTPRIFSEATLACGLRLAAMLSAESRALRPAVTTAAEERRAARRTTFFFRRTFFLSCCAKPPKNRWDERFGKTSTATHAIMVANCRSTRPSTPKLNAVRNPSDITERGSTSGLARFFSSLMLSARNTIPAKM